MKKSTFVLFLVFATLKTIVAQINNHHATLTTTNGNTYNGTLEYFNPFDNENKVRFKADGASESITYAAGKIKQLITESGVILEGHGVSYDKTDNRISTITYETTTQLVTDTVLLRVLAEGPIKLWIYHPPLSRDYFFIQKEGQKIEELGLRRKKDEATGSIITLYIYRNLLSFYTHDNPSLQSDISTLPFDEDAIKRLVKKYNTSKGYVNTRKESINGKGFRITFTPHIGVMAVTMKFFDFVNQGPQTTYSALAYSDFTASPTWQVAGETELWVPERFGPVSIPINIGYNTNKHTGYHLRMKEDVYFKSATLNIGIGIKYSILISPNWRIAPSLGFKSNKIASFETDIPEFGNTEGSTSYYLQLSVLYKHWVAAIEYQKSNSFVYQYSYGGTYQRTGFTLGYRFGD